MKTAARRLITAGGCFGSRPYLPECGAAPPAALLEDSGKTSFPTCKRGLQVGERRGKGTRSERALGTMEDSMDGQTAFYDVEAANYDAFTEKFKPKLTTDDCYTPEPVYDAIAARCRS